MNPKIVFTKQIDPSTGNHSIAVQIIASKEAALELLAYGTRNVMECMGITMTDYLEALMDARENPILYRTIIDTSLLAQMDKQVRDDEL